jgi:hypothetical protein
MPNNKIAPLFFVNSSIMFCVSLLKCLVIEKIKENKAEKVKISSQQDGNMTMCYAMANPLKPSQQKGTEQEIYTKYPLSN